MGNVDSTLFDPMLISDQQNQLVNLFKTIDHMQTIVASLTSIIQGLTQSILTFGSKSSVALRRAADTALALAFDRSRFTDLLATVCSLQNDLMSSVLVDHDSISWQRLKHHNDEFTQLKQRLNRTMNGLLEGHFIVSALILEHTQKIIDVIRLSDACTILPPHVATSEHQHDE